MSVFGKLIWFVKGMKEYTKGGYTSAAKNFKSDDIPTDVSGKSYMITGANSGLGRATALALAQRGGTVHLVCRNKERGEEAKTDIIQQTGNQNVYLHLLDTSQPRDIYKFVETFQSTGSGMVDVLINNAGCMVNTREVTEDGLEKNFATNTLGTHILTTALVPLLSQSRQPRVIIVSSGGMLTQKLNLNDLQFEKMRPFDGTMAYAQNKRQQIVMTEHYAQKYPRIHFSVMHPGWADTPGQRYFQVDALGQLFDGMPVNMIVSFLKETAVKSAMPEFYEKMQSRLRTVEEGADTIIWLAASDAAVKHDSGLFFQGMGCGSGSKMVYHLHRSAWTQLTKERDQNLMSQLEQMGHQFTSTT